MRLVLRGLGWACIAAGALLALYLVYSLYWTGLETAAAQESLREAWEAEIGPVAVTSADPGPDQVAPDDEFRLDVGEVESTIEGGAPPTPGPTEEDTPVPPGGAVAAMHFDRPGAALPPVLAEPIYVVEGVSDEELRDGPGHYPGTAMPGEDGNFGVAGHRTTYGSPFWALDQVQAGDQVNVTDRGGARWVYEVVETRIVAPDDVEVLLPDPLGTGQPTLTLTTCHPRFSNAERLVVFAELTPV